MTSIYQVPVNRADGTPTTLAEFRGKVMLIVNVASACGLTPQYTALEQIFEKYRERGFTVVAFPCNDFGAQEPGTAAEIEEFCTTKFGVKFPLLEKITVAHDQRHPLYRELIAAQPAATSQPGANFRQKLEGYGIKIERDSDIMWNFEKFLVDREGEVVARFSPEVPPDDAMITSAIESRL
ncbi:MAG: glutathione peroxidase [Myxococcales bacterium]|nr:glutathione peroxidase [Myxococcales bacterium]